MKVKAARKASPLTLSDLHRWDEFTSNHGDDGDPKKARGVDKRLFSVPPAILGVIDAMRKSGHFTADAVRLANRGVGQFQRDGYRWNDNADPHRAHVVYDWAVRYALPIWLERLPTWCEARAAAVRVRDLGSLQWVDAYVAALSVLTPAWVSLIHGPVTERGVDAERRAISRVGAVAGELVGGLARELAWLTYRYANHYSNATRKDTWHVRSAVRAVATATSSLAADSLDDEQIAASLPALIEVLLAVTPGDSQASVADRCMWITRRSSKKRAA